MWEIPVYVSLVPPDERCADYGVAPGLRDRLAARRAYYDPELGEITGMDWNLWLEFAMSPAEFLATLRYTLDQRLAGNRCPLPIGLHSALYAEDADTTGLGATAAERRRAVTDLVDDLLSRPEVRVVSAAELLDWLRNPVPLGGVDGPE
jgi:hypothetical protein